MLRAGGALSGTVRRYTPPDEMVERLSRFLDSHTWGKMGKGVQLMQNIPVTQAQLHSVDGPGQRARQGSSSLPQRAVPCDS